MKSLDKDMCVCVCVCVGGGLSSRRVYVHLVKLIRRGLCPRCKIHISYGGLCPRCKIHGEIMSTYTKNSRGDFVQGDIVRIPIVYPRTSSEITLRNILPE